MEGGGIIFYKQRDTPFLRSAGSFRSISIPFWSLVRLRVMFRGAWAGEKIHCDDIGWRLSGFFPMLLHWGSAKVLLFFSLLNRSR